MLDESQVYRIDHYLGKETVQNILALRFGNSIFEPVWNRRHVSSVQVTVAEEVGMAGSRGAYYDTAGTIRDMVQNHMMQLLCLVAMEPPSTFPPTRSATKRSRSCRPSLAGRPPMFQERGSRAVLGLHPGEPRFRAISRRKGLRLTRRPTLIRDPAGVEYLAVGRCAVFPADRQAASQASDRIAIEFHRPPTELFEPESEGSKGANQLVLRIQPNEGASLTFEAKVPGSRRRLQEVRMDFRYGTAFALPPPRPTNDCFWT